MIGLVLVSHSESLAKSVVDLTAVMAPDARIAAAGGLEDGSFGTSFEKIKAAIESVYTEEGVLVLMDMGSAVMTTEMVIEMMEDKKVEMVDCPLVEGAVAATVSAAGGMDFEAVKAELEKVGTTRKF